MTSKAYERIYATVKRIPRGRVATYGDIAELAQASGPRQVGYALHALPENRDVPWYRVINARGEVSPRAWSDGDELQRVLLEAEGVEFDERGRVTLERYRWSPTGKAASAAPARRSGTPSPARARMKPAMAERGTRTKTRRGR